MIKFNSSYFFKQIFNHIPRISSRSITIHASLVSIYKKGILILGESGIGKSDCVLELVAKGHTFISDDMVTITKKKPNTLIGFSPKLLSDRVHIRGIGIVQMVRTFGRARIRTANKINGVISLMPWEPHNPHCEIEPALEEYVLLGTKLKHLKIPMTNQRHATTLIEAAVKQLF